MGDDGEQEHREVPLSSIGHDRKCMNEARGPLRWGLGRKK